MATSSLSCVLLYTLSSGSSPVTCESASANVSSSFVVVIHVGKYVSEHTGKFALPLLGLVASFLPFVARLLVVSLFPADHLVLECFETLLRLARVHRLVGFQSTRRIGRPPSPKLTSS